MHLNIRTKLFLLLAGLAGFVVFGMLFAINQTMTAKISEKIINDFQQTQAVFQKEQELRYDRLIESATLIGENSVFKANLSLNDPASVYFSVDEFSQMAKVDLFIVTNGYGTVMAKLGYPEVNGNDLSEIPFIKRALQGYFPDEEQITPELWQEDEGLYQVVCVPVFTREETILGTITLGTLITDVEAEELKGETRIDISFFTGDTMIASTFDSAMHSFSPLFYKNNRETIKQVLSTLNPSNSFEWLFGENFYFTFIGPLGKGVNAYYVAMVPKVRELALLTDLQVNILIAGLISLILILIIAFYLGKQFSNPILKLVSGMDLVRKGNLSHTVEVKSKDEIGLLAQSFNQMIVGLRERLNLMKYVGSHTIDMIKKTSADQVILGGEKKEITVLFSDIRNFTRYSEKKDPEEIINALNRHLGIQSELVDLYGGSVDKFIGDEMLALFAGEDALDRTIKCGLQIQKILKKEFENKSEKLNVGIGINRGEVIMGNMGAQDRMDYTVIGSVVNLGSRLCNAAKAGQILIPELLVKNLGNFVFSGAQAMKFKGIQENISVVEVINEK